MAYYLGYLKILNEAFAIAEDSDALDMIRSHAFSELIRTGFPYRIEQDALSTDIKDATAVIETDGTCYSMEVSELRELLGPLFYLKHPAVRLEQNTDKESVPSAEESPALGSSLTECGEKGPEQVTAEKFDAMLNTSASRSVFKNNPFCGRVTYGMGGVDLDTDLVTSPMPFVDGPSSDAKGPAPADSSSEDSRTRRPRHIVSEEWQIKSRTPQLSEEERMILRNDISSERERLAKYKETVAESLESAIEDPAPFAVDTQNQSDAVTPSVDFDTPMWGITELSMTEDSSQETKDVQDEAVQDEAERDDAEYVEITVSPEASNVSEPEGEPAPLPDEEDGAAEDMGDTLPVSEDASVQDDSDGAVSEDVVEGSDTEDPLLDDAPSIPADPAPMQDESSGSVERVSEEEAHPDSAEPAHVEDESPDSTEPVSPSEEEPDEVTDEADASHDEEPSIDVDSEPIAEELPASEDAEPEESNATVPEMPVLSRFDDTPLDPNTEPKSSFPSQMAQDDFTLAYHTFEAKDGKGQVLVKGEAVIHPLSIEDERPEIVVWASDLDGTESTVRCSRDRKTVLFRLKGIDFVVGGYRDDGEFKAHIDVTQRQRDKLHYRVSSHVRYFGDNGHLEITDKGIDIHVFPNSFKNLEDGLAEFCYWIKQGDDAPVVGYRGNGDHVVFNYNGSEHELIAKWNEDLKILAATAIKRD